MGKKTFTVKITDPGNPPSFLDSEENTSFYRALAGNTQIPIQYVFAQLMVQAKQLLASSQSIHTVKELRTKKKEFHQFIETYYQTIRHSDMIRRMLDQYFMMHEYVDYHVGDIPATNNREKYENEVLNGVADWLNTLSPSIPVHEILNYCISFYYNRSMVTLSSLIMENFQDIAFCPGEVPVNLTFPDDLLILVSTTNETKNLTDFKGSKVFCFVSEQCPVSMVAAVSRARKMVVQNQPIFLIIVPMEELSTNHLIMNRMIHNGNLLFVSDEKWRKSQLAEQIRLPFFITTP